MVSTPFESILKDFEPFFKCPLIPDKNNSCLIVTDSGLSFQFEINSQGQLLIGSRLGILTMTRYRANLLREALKSNELALPLEGIFGFSTKSNQLILFITVAPHLISPDQIAHFMPPFLIRAKQWSEAILNGKLPSVEQKNDLESPMRIFGATKKE